MQSAYANKHRDARLFGEVAAVLMRRARRLQCGEPTELVLDRELFAIDTSLIKLSLAFFSWGVGRARRQQ